MMQTFARFGALLALVLLASSSLPAQEASPADAKAEAAKTKAWLENLQYETGTVSIRSGLATAHLTPEFKYLNPEDSKKLLTVMGNPPADNLGLILPKGWDLLNPKPDGGSWFIVLEYQDDGHVKDDDAKSIDYAKLMREMQEGAQSANAEREKQGYGAVNIVGWAEQPRYDETAKKLYWAKEIKFGGEAENTLNYNIRMLGRGGVLVLNAVSSMEDLPAIQKASPEILQMVDFNEGQRYADYEPSKDKLATYGIAALVAGGIAAKAGLFKTLLIGLLALKKFVIIGAIAVVALIKRIAFGGKKRDPEA